MDQDDREQIERALARIPRDAWDTFLDSEEGRELGRRREAVREALRCTGKLAPGGQSRPTRDVVDLLGHRLLSDRTLGHGSATNSSWRSRRRSGTGSRSGTGNSRASARRSYTATLRRTARARA